MGSMLDTGAASRAKKDAELQKAELRKQQQKEDARAAESEDETARRKAVAAKGGARGSLLTGAETGVKPANKPATASKMGG